MHPAFESWNAMRANVIVGALTFVLSMWVLDVSKSPEVGCYAKRISERDDYIRRGDVYLGQRYTTIMVRNLPEDTRPSDLRTKFDEFGAIVDIYLPKWYNSGKPRGFAFVEFQDETSAQRAESSLNITGLKILDQDCNFNIARRKRLTREFYNRKRGAPYRSSGPRQRRRDSRPPRYYRSPVRSPVRRTREEYGSSREEYGYRDSRRDYRSPPRYREPPPLSYPSVRDTRSREMPMGGAGPSEYLPERKSFYDNADRAPIEAYRGSSVRDYRALPEKDYYESAVDRPQGEYRDLHQTREFDDMDREYGGGHYDPRGDLEGDRIRIGPGRGRYR
uniref:RRM domain-containing protein n=1 Tax=Amorphochlora amoebiformis TaxID=1561963 RepID=A0A7S0GN02_9EUKA|mmetsp:Transcript_11079/g.17520  ORF Transcript_11079/g.17520 Transcript_11079/m.17520 type:complete len:333 (+) Transcript_11079:105-1103(+)